MRKLVVFMLLLSGTVFGQDFRSGDVDLDANLKVINTDANKDLTAFKAEIVKTFSTTLPKVEACFKVGMSAGDAFMAFQVATISKKPIETVITSFNTNKGKGWGVIAKEMGIKPGSDAFHQLKGNCKTKGDKVKAKGNSGNKGNSSKSTGNSSNGKSNGHSGKSNGSNGKGKK